ncbi:MAG TPA: TonB-dependent receptor [Pyrinomonadaceae bacterium]|nr:TonB-dependent receptor [Pyrinomonadaceae bacterium]
MSTTHKRVLFGLTLLIAVVLGVPALAKSQTASGSVSGTVKDKNGASVTGAEVALVYSHGTLKSTVSGNDGSFTFDDVATGTYGLTVVHGGFGKYSTVVYLASGEKKDLTVELEVNPLSERMVISAEAGQVADAKLLAQPINLVSEEEILLRAPEVVAQVVDEEQGVNLQRTSPSLSAVFIRGLTGRNVAVYVDGVRYTTSAQRGGVGTFFSLIEPSSLGTVEVLRGPNSSQYGSDAHGGVINFLTHAPRYGDLDTQWHGTTNTFYSSPTNGFGANQLLTYGKKNWGVLMNLNARRINRLRPGAGLDSHSAATRFLGIPSDVLGTRLPDTAFTQYGGLFRLSFDLDPTTQVLASYDRNQQDGGRRYDQLAGGDGNLIADLRNLISDQFHARVMTQRFGIFDNASATFSYNGQREERINQGGNGNPVGTITNQRERTTVLGFNAYVDKQLGERNTFLLGADIYSDRIAAPATTFDPVPRTVVNSRPRIPHGARYLAYGFFAQDVFTAVPERVRISAALRYSVASYRAQQSDAPVVGGRSLFPSDSERFGAFSGRVGAVVYLGNGFDLAGKYSRGFRAPNTTDLGIVGFVGTGFEVNSQTATDLGGFIGTTAGADAVSTGLPVTRLKPEFSDGFDVALRYNSRRFSAELIGFTTKLNDVYFDQALILPAGAVGKRLGSELITAQNVRGWVSVGNPPAGPVLVRVNFDDARFNGIEFNSHGRISDAFTAKANFTYVRAYSLLNGLPPNVEGGVPNPAAFMSLKYQPRSKFWLEAYSTIAWRQRRLSSLDLGDRRTGAARSRTAIQNFFRRGACVRGLTTPGPTGCGSASATATVVSTGETLLQVQNRLLPIGATINGVTVVDNNSNVPLYTAVPGYGLIGLRGGVQLSERSEFLFDFENIGDKQYRGISWGIDGAGRGITLRYRYKF